MPMMLLVKRMALAIKAVFTPLQVVMATSGVGNRHVHVHVLPVYGLYGHGSTASSSKVGAYPRAACLLYLLTARSYASARSCRAFISNVSSLGLSTQTQYIRP